MEWILGVIVSLSVILLAVFTVSIVVLVVVIVGRIATDIYLRY